MTQTDFFRLIIKLFGLYSLILVVFGLIPQNFAYFNLESGLLAVGWGLLIVLIPVTIFIFLLFRTDLIIRVLRLDQGFDEDRIELGNFNSRKLAQFAILLLGGYLMVCNIPDFLVYTFLAFKKEIAPGNQGLLEGLNWVGSVDYHWWAVSGFNVVLGYLFVTNYAKLAGWLVRRGGTTNAGTDTDTTTL